PSDTCPWRPAYYVSHRRSEFSGRPAVTGPYWTGPVAGAKVSLQPKKHRVRPLPSISLFFLSRSIISVGHSGSPATPPPFTITA
ncbi:MAG: hypothetical protein AABY62_06830, partial [Pseudomonadota bacterium]